MSTLSELDDQQIRDILRQHGTQRAAAKTLGVTRSALQRRLNRIQGHPSTVAPRASGPRLTRAGLLQALKPPNLCPVKVFLDTLDEADRDLVDEAMGWPSNPQQGGMSHKRLRQWLVDEGGFANHEVPSEGQIENHRAGKGGCKCRD